MLQQNAVCHSLPALAFVRWPCDSSKASDSQAGVEFKSYLRRHLLSKESSLQIEIRLKQVSVKCQMKNSGITPLIPYLSITSIRS